MTEHRERTDEFESEEWDQAEAERPRRTWILPLAAIVLVVLVEVTWSPAASARRFAGAYAEAPASPAPPLESSITVEELLAMRQAVVAEDFATLDRTLTWNGAEARSDPRYEHRHRAVLDLFDTTDPDLRAALDRWVARTPASPAAHLARAAHFTALGWEARGHEFASKTPNDRMERMREWFRLAESDLAAAKRLDSTNVMVYWLHLGLIGGARVDRREVLDEGLRQLPGSLLLRTRFQYYQRPRWNSNTWRGPIAAMVAFADEADRSAAGYPRLRLIRGFVPFDSAESLYQDDENLAAIEMYSRALRHGDYWMFRLGRANAYFDAQLWQQARQDYDAVLTELPTSTEARARRALACLHLYWHTAPGPERDAMRRCTSDDVAIALALDPYDPDLLRVLRRNPKLREWATRTSNVASR